MKQAKIMGAKYAPTADLDIKQIAKLVRADIKVHEPAVKASVTIGRFARGYERMDILILEAPYELRHGVEGFHRPTVEGEKLRHRVQELADQYNYNDSDMMSDHYDVRFGLSVRLAHHG